MAYTLIYEIVELHLLFCHDHSYMYLWYTLTSGLRVQN
jgi:hypothetical protein